MKHYRLVLIVALLMPLTTPAMAASVVMLQFGSFETQPEADKRLADIKATHPDLLTGLTASVREVKLPPDNLTVFRTQAGPLDSRASAQALCLKFAATGDECYVVETAVTGTAATQMANAAATPMTVSAPSASTLPTTTVLAPSPAATTGATSTTLPALAPLSSLGNGTGNASPTFLPAPVVTSPDMQAAMDRAVLAQNAAEVNPTPAPANSTANPSFWGRLNPFAGTTSKTPTTKPVSTVVAAPDATPIAPVAVAASNPPAPPAITPLPAPPPATIAPAPAPTSPNNEAMITYPVASVASDQTAPHLLPPPAPLTAQDKKYLTQQQQATIPTPPPEPLMTPATPPAPAPAGSVRVEEAKRVPLSAATAPVTVAAPVTMAAPSVSLMPSATLGQKTLWAQLGQFNDKDTALAFWDNYRQTHPDFPAVRVRVISSMQQQTHGNDRLWLRVGPFGRESSIHNLCTSVHAAPDDVSQNLHCGNVTDLGIAGTTNTTPGYLNGSRYSR